MTDLKKKGKYIGLLGAVLVHVAFIVFLFLMGFTLPEPQEESGVPVMLGDVPQASGWSDPSLVEVETMPAEEVVPQDAIEQELITQDLEETVALTPESEKEVEKPEKTEAEKAEEARRLAEERAERERREAEEAARRRVSGAFGKGAPSVSVARQKKPPVVGCPVPLAREQRWRAGAMRRRVKACREALRAMLRRALRQAWAAMASSTWADALSVRADCHGLCTTCRTRVAWW